MHAISDLKELAQALDDGLKLRAIDVNAGIAQLCSFYYKPSEDVLKEQSGLDPYSNEYFAFQMRLFDAMTGGAHAATSEGHETAVPELGPLKDPFPFYMAPQDVGYWTVIFGHLLQRLALPKGARVLEIGYGQGGLTEVLARSGLDLTGAEMRQTNATFLKRRLGVLGIDVRTAIGDILEQTFDQPFDAIVFFESFHHMPRFSDLIGRLGGYLKTGGKLVFGAEPIVNDDDPVVPFPWGLRMDGEALGASRDLGWAEFGFQRTFFREMLARHGFSTEEHRLDGYHHSHVVIATRQDQTAG